MSVDAPTAATAHTDADSLRRIILSFRDGLVAHKEVLNALNVYPVPDGDTGTNMSLTLGSVVEEIEAAAPDLESTCTALSHGSLMGARGNSGVILSQVMRGVSSILINHEQADAAVWSEALTEAATEAYGAVARPVEGTILTVVRESAEAAAKAVSEGAALGSMLEAALTEGRASLARTPELLPELADAGVVDAGAAGFLLFLEAALYVVSGQPMSEAPDVDTIDNKATSGGAPVERPDDHGESGEKSIADLRYEVMFFLSAPDEAVDSFKQAWMEIGDSIVVVGGDGLYNCHIHCDEIGPAIEAGIAVGTPSKIRVTDLLEELEHQEEFDLPDEPDVLVASFAPATTAVVAVAVGEGVRSIFESLGVQAVVAGGQSMNPSTELLAKAVEQVKADQVVILPNNKNIIAVAERVNEATDKSIGVVPTRSIAEGFAALLAYDPGAQVVNNVASMTAAGAAVEAGEVCQAVRDSKSDAGVIKAGDWMGLTRKGITTIAPTLIEATCSMLDDMIDDDHEIVTLIRGADANNKTVKAVEQWIESNRPDVEVEVHAGGQPLYPFYVGVE